MDLIGEIVEKDVGTPTLPVIPDNIDISKVQALKEKRKSAFAARRKNRNSKSAAEQKINNTTKDESNPNELSEAEKIHRENMEKLASMSEEDIEKERNELLNQLNPKLIQSLMKRAEKREAKSETTPSHTHNHQHAEGYSEWIGGIKTSEGVKELSYMDKDDINKALGISSLSLDEPEKTAKKSNKKVRFDNFSTVMYEDLPDGTVVDESGWEDIEDINDLIPENEEVAPEDYQLVQDQDDVHFTKPKSDSQEYGHELDLNDPQFYDKLHEKYYPDLPKETSKLAWMTEPLPKQTSSTYESIADMRFDFQGNLVNLDSNTENEIPSYLGLHHHSDNPHLPGYTLAELVHLLRSVVAGQRCLSIQMLGRILHKLGLHKYSIIPISDNEGDEAFNENAKAVIRDFEKMMWDVIDELRIIESISEAADEKKTLNLSVRNYAIEALWLWKQGGGRPEPNQEEELANVM